MACWSPRSVLLLCMGMLCREAGGAAGTCRQIGMGESCSTLTHAGMGSDMEVDIERQEATEVGLADVELLQRSSHTLRSLSVGNDTNAKKSGERELVRSNSIKDKKLEVRNVDQNGHVCVFCDGPLPERVGEKKYEAFRTDCGGRSSPKGLKAEDIFKPAVQFLKESGGERNAMCELNFAKACVDAVANKDYLYWAKSLDLSQADMRENVAWDAQYCQLNGFLKPAIARLQHNFTGLSAMAAELCRTKYAAYGIEKITFGDILMERNLPLPTLSQAERLAAWNCAMGDLGCDMAMCSYSFCQLGSGSDVGIYGECEGWHPVNGMPVSV